MIFDAHEIDNRIPPNKYTIHTTDGYHMFYYRCSNDKFIHPLYREKIWPYVEINKYNKMGIMIPRATKKDPYPRVNIKFFKEGECLYMHQIIGLLKKKNKAADVVNHINSNPVDYRLKNLEYVTLSQNAKGTDRNKINYDQLYDTYLLRGFPKVYEFK